MAGTIAAAGRGLGRRQFPAGVDAGRRSPGWPGSCGACFRQQSRAEHEVARASGMSLHLGMDTRGEVERQVRQFLFGRRRRTGPASRHFGRAGDLHELSCPRCSRRAATFRRRTAGSRYVRIATFNVGDDDAFLEEFIRDHRSAVTERNDSGRARQPRRADPRGRAASAVAHATHNRSVPVSFPELRAHREDHPAARLSRVERVDRPGRGNGSRVLTGPHAVAGCRVQRYRAEIPGPVVLVTDALCYSTTDIFAAGFQDNQIGKVLGVDESTGAGGANVWEYPLICDLLRRPGQFPRDLPGSASFRFAVRRVTRIGRASGLPLEDFGVRPDEVHEFTRRDVLKRNVDSDPPRSRTAGTHAEAAAHRHAVGRLHVPRRVRQHRPCGCLYWRPAADEHERARRPFQSAGAVAALR